MNSTTHSTAAAPQWALRTATLLAVVVAIGYLAIGLGFVPEDFESPPAPVMILAGVAYIVGGILILLADHRLLLLGAVANSIVLLLFLAAAVRGNSTVDLFSVSEKIVQLALGLLLIWLARRACSASKPQHA